jgi:hypothetical protein
MLHRATNYYKDAKLLVQIYTRARARYILV